MTLTMPGVDGLRETIDFSDFETKEIHRITVPVVPKEKLITYKKRHAREVDLLDIGEMSRRQS